MTLVIARRTASEIVVASDIRTTDRGGRPTGYPLAVLKAVTVTDTLCVGFADNVARGLAGIRAVKDLDASRFDHVLERLTEFSVPTHGMAAEFLVVSSRPVRIACVRAGVVSDNLQFGWIGDEDAHEAFKRHMLGEFIPRAPQVNPSLPPPGTFSVTGVMSLRFTPKEHPAPALAASVYSAFGAVLEGDFPTVGEAAIFLDGGTDGILRYRHHAVAQLAAPVNSAGEAPLQIVSVVGGKPTYVTLLPRDPGPGAAGLHFPHYRLGLLYHPLERSQPFDYRDVDDNAFAEAVRVDHGIELRAYMRPS